MDKNSITSLTNDQRIMLLKEIENIYKEEVKFTGAQLESNTFIWLNEPLNYWIVQMKNKDFNSISNLILFATRTQDSNKLTLVDLRESTNTYEIQSKSYDADSTISKLIKNELINIKEDIIKESTKSISVTNDDIPNLINDFNFRRSIKKFVDNEYDKQNKNLSAHESIVKYDNRIFFANKYDFESIIQNVNDKYFEAALNDCLWAYNKGKWFLSAASIGSIIETLLYDALNNYCINNKLKNLIFSKLGKTPTISNYINAMQIEPISINKKQIEYLSTIFKIRNCVDHYATGYTSKGMVDILLSGITNVYNDYYVKSVDYKNEYESSIG